MPTRNVLMACCLAFAWAAAIAAQDTVPATAPSPTGERDPAGFARRPASGRYVDPESRFSLQGYVTGTYADFQQDWLRNGFDAPGQLLVPRTEHGSFQYDWALFIGSKLNENLRFVVETHFVTKPDGSFQPEIVTTEAQVTWLPFENKHAFRLSLGQYWAPFAGVNDDWFSAVNLFAVVPFAARAFPLHFNERGVAVEGEFDLRGGRGLNYVASLGNGVSGMSIEDQHGFDLNDNKTVMGRVGFFPAGPSLELGLSGAIGDFRDALDPTLPAADARRYAASFGAVAADVRFSRAALEVRSYAIRSTEDLEGAADLGRWGLMAEASLRVSRSLPVLRECWLKARYDRSRLDNLGGPALEDEVFSFGLNVKPARRSMLKVEGFLHAEKDGRQLRDNGFVVQMSASF
jgi:hypothetical protein